MFSYFSTIPYTIHIFLILLGTWSPIALKGEGQNSALRLEDILVTTEKWPNTVQNIPQSVSVLSSEDLRLSGIESIKDASYLVPNLYISEFSSRRTSFPYFRGLGSGQGEPVVTTFIDGVPQLTPNTTNIDLLDINRIEFVRGPQGALYGRNTSGGVIHIITKKPEGVTKADAEITLGEFDLQRYKFSLQAPIQQENFYLGVSGSYLEKDGYTKNEITGNSIDDRESTSGKITARILPSENLEIALHIFGERDRDGPFTLFDLDSLRDNPFQIRNDFEGKTERDIASPTLSLKYHGEKINLTSITGYSYWKATDETDLDFTSLDAQRRTTEEKHYQFYQELRMASSENATMDFSKDLSVQWILGISLFHSEFDHQSVNEFGSQWPFGPQNDFVADYTLRDFGTALFGQGTVVIKDRLDLTLGLRVDYERRESDLKLPPIKQDLDENFFNILPKFGLTYRLPNQAIVYTYVAKGFRAGGYNRNSVPNGRFEVDEEKSWTYELGLKTSWLEDRLRLNLSAFYIDWDDMQVDVADSNFQGVFFLENVGESTSKGVEIELTAKLNSALELFASYGYTDAEFLDYSDSASQQNFEGEHLPNVPQFTWLLGLQGRLTIKDDLHLFVRSEVTGVGKVYFDSANSVKQNDYALVNFVLGIGGQNWSLNTWIRNAFDEEFIVLALPSNFSPSGFAGQSGPPQTAGINLKFRM